MQMIKDAVSEANLEKFRKLMQEEKATAVEESAEKAAALDAKIRDKRDADAELEERAALRAKGWDKPIKGVLERIK